MADDPNSSSVPSANNSNNTIINDNNNQGGDKEKEDCVEEEKYSSANEAEKNDNEEAAAAILPPSAIPSPSENPISLVDSSAEVFNDEYDKSSTVVKCGRASCKNTLYIRKCSAPQCGKLQCYHCIHMLYKKHRLSSLLLEDDKVDPTHNEEIPVCTKGCYNTVKKFLTRATTIEFLGIRMDTMERRIPIIQMQS